VLLQAIRRRQQARESHTWWDQVPGEASGEAEGSQRKRTWRTSLVLTMSFPLAELALKARIRGRYSSFITTRVRPVLRTGICVRLDGKCVRWEVGHVVVFLVHTNDTLVLTERREGEVYG
jgi:hypothetical protein